MFPLLVLTLRRSDEWIPFPAADHVFEVPGRPTDGRVLFGQLRQVLGNAEAARTGAAANGFGHVLGNVTMELWHGCTSHMASLFGLCEYSREAGSCQWGSRLADMYMWNFPMMRHSPSATIGSVN